MLSRFASAFAIAAIAMPATAAPRARGKVVRVERERGSRVAPRVCDLRSDKGGSCLGSKPDVGEIVRFLDETGVIAEAQIVEATPFSAASNCQALWNIRAEVTRGDLSAMTSRTVGLIDRELRADRARMIPREKFPPAPSGRIDETVIVAVDRDGDRNPDLLIVQGQCDHASTLPSGTCIDQWSLVNDKMIRVQQTNFAACGL